MAMETKRLMNVYVSEQKALNTRYAYKRVLANLWEFARNHPLGKEKDLLEMEHKDARQVIKDFLWEAGTRLRSSTVANYGAVISGWYAWLIAEGEVTANPAAKLNLNGDRSPKKRDFPTPEMADRLLNYLEKRVEKVKAGEVNDSKALRDLVLVGLLRYGGFRSSEVLDLKVQDVKDGLVEIRHTKRDKHRTAVIPANVMDAVTQYVGSMRLHPDQYLFRLRKKGSTVMTRQNLSYLLTSRALKAGLTEREAEICSSPHGWRHLWTTERVTEGMDLGVIAALGGWANFSLITYYAVQGQVAKMAQQGGIG